MEPQPSNTSLSSSTSPFHQLPPEAVACVLGAVPQQPRFAVCALVCRAWRDAALAATTQLELAHIHGRLERVAQLSAWLARHGSRLHSLSVETGMPYHFVSLQLPWPLLRQLRSLNLDEVTFFCNKSSGTAGAGSQPGPSSRAQQLAQLTSLTSLVLKGCTISSGVRDLYQQQLPALRQLQELVMLSWHGIEWALAGLGTALAAALAQLTALTHLHVVVAPDGAAAVISSLSSVRRLQALGLSGDGGMSGDGTFLSISWSDLPASVTALELSGFIHWRLQADISACCPLTALQQLSIQPEFGFSGAPALCSLPQLRQLDITAACFDEARAAVAGTRCLLAALAQQQELQSLKLHCNLTLPADQTQHFAALAASSQLTVLGITVAGETPASGVLSAMFGAGRQLPLLQCLDVWKDDAGEGSDVTWALAPQDVSQLLRACPGLRELSFLPESSDAAAAAPEPAAGVVAWSDLAGTAAAQLTKLVVDGGGVNAAFISQLLARLTGLRDLTLLHGTNITWQDLVPLTRLTGLTWLRAPVEDPDAWADDSLPGCFSQPHPASSVPDDALLLLTGLMRRSDNYWYKP